MSSISKFSRYFFVSIAALAISTPALAQLDEIVVTAQKREQSILDVPISISALTSEQFEIFDVKRADDLEFVFANVGSNRRASGNTGISIRGVGTDNVHLSGQQSVGTYVDDVSMVSPYVSAIAIYDMERVELLRGPQNTLYGRNTTGGAVLWHTNKANPGDGLNGYAQLKTGSGGLARLEAALGFDFSDSLAGRVSVLSDEFDGVWTNMVDGKDTGGAYDRSGGRLNLVWDGGGNASLGLTVSTGEMEIEDLATRMSGNRGPDGLIDPDYVNRIEDRRTGTDDYWVTATAADVAATPWLQDQYLQGTGIVIDNPDTPDPCDPALAGFNCLVNYSTNLGSTYQDPEDFTELEWDGVRLNFEYDFGGVVLTSLTAYDETYVLEKNGQELTGFSPAREGDWETFQTELRLKSDGESAVQWLAGLYLMDIDSQEDTWVSNVAAAGGMGVVPGIDIDSKYEMWSAYGQITWAISDSFGLTAGLRYTDDKLSADNDNWVRTVCAFHPSAVGARSQTREYRAADCPGSVPGRLAGNTHSPVQELSETGYHLSVNYQPNDSSMFFLSTSKGFKGGAYDNRALSTGDDPIGPEFLTAYELGYKGTFADGKVQLNAAYYQYDWEDLQLFESIGGIPWLLNVPGIDIQGFEADIKWAPNDNLYVQGGIGFVDSEIVDVTGMPAGSAADLGDEVTKTPDTTANLLASYTIPIGGNELTLLANYRYQSSLYYTFFQKDFPRDESSDYHFLNARVAFAFGSNQQYNVAVWGNNLTEELTCNNIIWGPAAPPQGNYSCEVGAYGEALYGMTFQANFGGN
jgi:iron complex outermembrane receptor protein